MAKKKSGEHAPEAEILMLTPAELRPDPGQPRKSFDQAALDELAASIKEHGVLQPLVVQYVGQTEPGDPTVWEIVAGERRWKAAKLAGLERVPCRPIKAHTLAVAEMQLVENIQRADLTTLELADAIHALVSGYDRTAPQVAAALGLKPRYVRELLRLRHLPLPAKAALASGRLPKKTADLIARVPVPEQRERFALAVLACKDYGTPTAEELAQQRDPLPLRRAEDLLERDYQRELKGAPWSLKDGKLYQAAGPCQACPKRAGVLGKEDPDTYGHLRADTCLDPQCYAQKLLLSGEKAADAARKAGMEVVEVPREYDVGAWGGRWLALDRAHAVPSTWGPTDKTLREILNEKRLDWRPHEGLALLPDGRTLAIVERKWCEKQLDPQAAAAGPEEEPVGEHYFGDDEEPPAAHQPAEAHKGPPDWQVCGEAGKLLVGKLLDAIGARLPPQIPDPELPQLLRVVLLATVARSDFEDGDRFLSPMQADREIDTADAADEEEFLARWKAWADAEDSYSLLQTLCELILREATAGLNDSPASELALELAGCSREQLLDEARLRLTPEPAPAEEAAPAADPAPPAKTKVKKGA